MEEFMTKVSDFINETKERIRERGGMLTFAMLGAVALIFIILCLLLLWHQKETEAEKAEKLLKAETFEVKQEEIMAAPDKESEELKKQYQTSIQYLEEKVEELLMDMGTVKETLESMITSEKETTNHLQVQIKEITEDITKLTEKLKDTQTQLYDLTDVVNVMEKETIPLIQEQMAVINGQMIKVNTDITNLYSKIAALETTDKELMTKIKELEGSFKISIENNMTDVTNRLQSMLTQVSNLENQIQELAGEMLQYRYEAESNTLFLFPR